MKDKFVEWNDEYLVGIDVIDKQHKRLIDVINELFEGLSEPRHDRDEAFRIAAKACVSYVKEHFSAEEKFLLERKYPHYALQKSEHTFFIGRLLDDADRYAKGDRLAPNRFVRFLADWLIKHIACEDRKYADYFGTRKAS